MAPPFFRALLRDLEITPGDDLEPVIETAWSMHVAASSDDAPLASTRLIGAAVIRNDGIRRTMRMAGLEPAIWPGTSPVALVPMPDDFAVSENIARALRKCARDSVRQLDAVTLTSAILETLEGRGRSQLERAGLKVDEAIRLLRGVKSAPPKLPMTESCYQLLERARDFAERNKLVPKLTGGLVIMSACRTSTSDDNTSGVLARAIVGSRGFPERAEAWLDWYAQQRLPNGDEPFVPQLQRALLLAFRTTKREEISARHLLAVLLTSTDIDGTSALATLEFLGVDPTMVRREILAYIERLVQAGSPDDIAVWRTVLGGSGNAAFTAPRYVLPTIHTEQLDGDDLLDFQNDVDAFATLIAAKNLNPPLSFGLFGDWGSGKSFFMRRLRRSVADIAEQAAAREKGGQPAGFCSRIVQIEFNAWHYVEANLWASLVEHIFRSLKLTEDESKETIEKRREYVLQQLDDAVARRLIAEKEVRDAERVRDQAATRLEVEKEEAQSARARLAAVRTAEPWDLIEIGEEQRMAVREAMHQLGIDRLIDSARDARDAVVQLADVGSRTHAFWLWLTQGPNAVTRISFFALATVAPFVLGVLVPQVKVEAELGTLVATLATWTGTMAAHGRTVLAKIDEARKAVDEKIRQAEAARRKTIEESERAMAEADKNLSTAAARLRQADADVREKQRAVAELSKDRDLARFIDERVASEDYRKHLGILAMVRRDFEKLSRLMTEQQASVPPQYRIDRIVLYIDDLDRCQPARVVEVLQAVHLLLAYPLFVVVVGVDARWVASSLERRHKHLLRNPGGPRLLIRRRNDLPGYQATPDDYLEKIFQVPFWIRRMNESAAAKLINGIVDIQPEPVLTQPDQSQQVSTSSTPSTPSTPLQSSLVSQSTSTATLIVHAGDDRLNPAKLLLDKREREAMLTLTQLIGRSPRTVKRFANSYRIIRAAKPVSELQVFLGDDEPFRRVLLLLAITIGAPNVAAELFREIAKASDQTLGVFADSLVLRAPADEWQRAIAAMKMTGNIELRDLRSDLPIVSRYSFRMPTA